MVTNVVLASRCGNSASAITPGSANMNVGVNLSRTANIAPQRACFRSLAPSTRWTFT